MTKYLYFTTNNVRACIELKYIEKVLSLVMLNAVPGGIPSLAGLLNLSGRSIPIFDLSMYLGLQRNKSYTLDTPIIILKDDNKESGIIVDKINSIVDVEHGLENVNIDLSNEQSAFVDILTIESELALQINVKTISSINPMKRGDCQSVDNALLKKVVNSHE